MSRKKKAKTAATFTSPKDAIDSRETYREFLEGALQVAHHVLCDSDDLEPRLMLAGPNTFIALEGAVPAEIAAAVVQKLIRQHPTVEVVFRVQLGRVIVSERPLSSGERIEDHPDAKLCVIVHASHRDLGFLAAHHCFVRTSANHFEFEEGPTWLEGHCSDEVLADPWRQARRHLNS